MHNRCGFVLFISDEDGYGSGDTPDVDHNGEHLYMPGTIEQEPAWDPDKNIAEQALVED